MHDERRRIEERVERLHNQRIKPAVHAATVRFEVEAWQAPGEPVPFEEAAAAPYAPFVMDTPWGPPWGTTWFRMRGRVPADFAGRRVEAVIDLGFVGDWPGNQAKALVHLTDGTPLKAVNPFNRPSTRSTSRADRQPGRGRRGDPLGDPRRRRASRIPGRSTKTSCRTTNMSQLDQYMSQLDQYMSQLDRFTASRYDPRARAKPFA
jgi:hypothetical protein